MTLALNKCALIVLFSFCLLGFKACILALFCTLRSSTCDTNTLRSGKNGSIAWSTFLSLVPWNRHKKSKLICSDISGQTVSSAQNRQTHLPYVVGRRYIKYYWKFFFRKVDVKNRIHSKKCKQKNDKREVFQYTVGGPLLQNKFMHMFFISQSIDVFLFSPRLWLKDYRWLVIPLQKWIFQNYLFMPWSFTAIIKDNIWKERF